MASSTPPISRLSAGPLFPVFVTYFAATAIYGAWNIIRARRRCLTPAARRRMTYLTISFAAPGLGVFPYLITAGLTFGVAEQANPIIVLLMAMAANVVVGTMLVLMAYSVAYYGVLSPDRVIKHDLFHYLLRGPVVGILVIVAMLVIPRFELILGLPRDTALIFVVVGVIVLGQLAVNAAKPWIDRLLYRQDQEEIAWIQTLDRRLLTSSDLRQFLSNVLDGLCELLRVRDGFVLVQTDRGLAVEVAVGDAEAARRYAAGSAAQEMWQRFSHERPAAGEPLTPAFCPDTGYWFCPLRSQDGDKLLGLLAVHARTQEVDLDEGERTEAEALLTQAVAAIADRHVQEGVFADASEHSARSGADPGVAQRHPFRAAAAIAARGLARSSAGRRCPADAEHLATVGEGCAQSLLGRPETDGEPAGRTQAGSAGVAGQRRKFDQSIAIGAVRSR